MFTEIKKNKSPESQQMLTPIYKGKEKYPYPFSDQVTMNRDIDGGRDVSRELERWYFVKEVVPEVTDGGTFAKDVSNDLIFVDDYRGLIKMYIHNDNGVLRITGGLYNPQKGKESLQALSDILKYIAHKTEKTVSYTTTRMNKTKHLADLLEKSGFEFDERSEEFTITFNGDAVPTNSYEELDTELLRLGLLPQS